MESGQLPRIPVYCDSPMAIKAVEVFLKHTEEYSDETRRLIAQYGSPLAVAGFYIRIYLRRIQEDQRHALSVDHRFIQWNGDRRTHPAPLDAAAARSEEYSDLYRLPGAGNAGLYDQERRRRKCAFLVKPCRSAPRSRPSNNSAITPILRSCWNGCAAFPTSPR